MIFFCEKGNCKKYKWLPEMLFPINYWSNKITALWTSKTSSLKLLNLIQQPNTNKSFGMVKNLISWLADLNLLTMAFLLQLSYLNSPYTDTHYHHAAWFSDHATHILSQLPKSTLREVVGLDLHIQTISTVHGNAIFWEMFLITQNQSPSTSNNGRGN